MIDFNYLHMREYEIKRSYGIPKDSRLRFHPRDTTDIFSVYFNPSTGLITGIRDNESNIFYKWTLDGEDLIKFIHKLNIRETEFTKIASSIESMTKRFIDTEIKLYEGINEYENQLSYLKKELNEYQKVMEEFNIEDISELKDRLNHAKKFREEV